MSLLRPRRKTAQSRSAITLNDQKLQISGTIRWFLGEEQRLVIADAIPNALNVWVGVGPRNEIVPFEVVSHLTIDETVYEIDKIGHVAHSLFMDMYMRRIPEP